MKTTLKVVAGLCFLMVFTAKVNGQNSKNDTIGSYSSKPAEAHYPEIKGYCALMHPIYTWSEDGNAVNFKNYYLVGNAWGINIWKSKKFGVSFEFMPFLRADKNGSKVSNILFHPGVLYKLGHNFTLIGRAAFETSGRYGFTPVINKVLVRGKNSTFFVAVMLPARFGNNHAPSLTTGFQFGVGF